MTRIAWTAFFACIAMSLVGLAVHGPVACLAVWVGSVSTLVSQAGTWLTVLWVGRLMRDESPSWQASVVPIAGFVIKLPVIFAAMSWAIRLGPPAPGWFLSGLALVYFGLVWWAVDKQRAPQEDFHE